MAGTTGIGVLTSDSLMFQRGEPYPSDEDLGSFYGLALPLLARGMPVEPVPLEHAGRPGYLDRYRLLLLTYEGAEAAVAGPSCRPRALGACGWRPRGRG